MEDRETVAFGFVEDVFVLVQHREHLIEQEWRWCMNEAMRSKSLDRMLLVPGALLPDVGRRFDIVELHEKHGTQVAILSDLPAADRVVTALKWAGIKAGGFAIADLDGMLAFLERAHVRARMSSMLGPYLERSWLSDLSNYNPAAAAPSPSRPGVLSHDTGL